MYKLNINEERDFLRVKNVLNEENKKDGLKCTLSNFCGFKALNGLCLKNLYCHYKAKEILRRELIRKTSTIEEIINIERKLNKHLGYRSLRSIIDLTKCRLNDNFLIDENGLIFNVKTHKLIKGD